MQRRITNPHKAGDEVSPAPAVAPDMLGRIHTPVHCSVRVGSHAFPFEAIFIPAGRTQEGAGVDTPSGSSATDNHVIHSSSFSSEPEQHHA